MSYVSRIVWLGRWGAAGLWLVQPVGLDRDPVAIDAGIDGLWHGEPASLCSRAEQPGGVPGDLPVLCPAVLDQRCEPFVVEIGKLSLEVRKITRWRVFLLFFLLRFYL